MRILQQVRFARCRPLKRNRSVPLSPSQRSPRAGLMNAVVPQLVNVSLPYLAIRARFVTAAPSSGSQPKMKMGKQSCSKEYLEGLPTQYSITRSFNDSMIQPPLPEFFPDSVPERRRLRDRVGQTDRARGSLPLKKPCPGRPGQFW